MQYTFYKYVWSLVFTDAIFCASFPMMFLTVFMFSFKGVKFYKKFPLVLLLQQISSQLIFDISYLLVYGVYQDMSKSG